MLTNSFYSYFNIDALAGIVVGLVVIIGITIGLFSRRYMAGDKKYRQYMVLLGLLVVSVAVMVSADHLVLFFITWAISNYLLIRLMIHKSSWPPAVASGWLAAKTMLIGLCSLGFGFILLYKAAGHVSIQAITHSFDGSDPVSIMALAFILCAAMTQSALWPFHRWLISSLNSPTPVSAMMHAGLVNGGGYLLARFAPCYLTVTTLLGAMFILGLMTALVASLWKLIQSDVKRMLACSTVAQMGFMVMQCGLGLFPAAVAHLCWHGLFKANLFLSSNSVVREKRVNTPIPPTLADMVQAFLSALFGSYFFVVASNQNLLSPDTRLVLVALAFITAYQFSLAFIKHFTWKYFPLVLLCTGVLGGGYGLSILAIESLMAPLNLMQPQPLNFLHIGGLLLLAAAWVVMLFRRSLASKKIISSAMLKGYVRALNASQPLPATITTHRNQYSYE